MGFSDIGYSGQRLNNHEYRIKVRAGSDINNVTGDAVCGEMFLVTGATPTFYIATATSTKTTSSVYSLSPPPPGPSSIDWDYLEMVNGNTIANSDNPLTFNFQTQEGSDIPQTNGIILTGFLDSQTTTNASLPISGPHAYIFGSTANWDRSLSKWSLTVDAGQLITGGSGYSVSFTLQNPAAAGDDCEAIDVSVNGGSESGAVGCVLGTLDVPSTFSTTNSGVYSSSLGAMGYDIVTYSVEGATFALTSNGDVYGCGQNESGQLGLGHTTSPITSPTYITGGVSDMTCSRYGALTSFYGTIFLTCQGDLYGCGNNKDWTLGLSSLNTNYLSPTYITGDVASVSSCSSHTLALKKNGDVCACGSGFSNSLGPGNPIYPEFTYFTGGVTAVSAGYLNSSFLSGSDWYACGFNTYQQLGPSPPYGNKVSQITFMTGGVSILKAAYLNVYTIDAEGLLSGAGNDTNGQLGQSSVTADRALTFIRRASNIFADGYNAFTISDGDLFGWGDDFGVDPSSNDHRPSYVTGDVNHVSSASEAGSWGDPSVLIVGLNGLQSGSGENSLGQLMNGSTVDTSQFVSGTGAMPEIGTVAFSLTGASPQMRALGNSSLFIDTESDVYGCGDNSEGQLGIGSTSPPWPNLPVYVTGNVESVFCGNDSSFFLTKSNDLYGCGLNDNGQLGDGTMTKRYYPTFITGDVIKGSANSLGVSWGGTLMLSASGGVYGCGRNNEGKLGLGDTLQRNSPTYITGGCINVRIAPRHSLFLNSSGEVYSAGFGAPARGQGSSPFNSVHVPTFTTGNVRSISASNGESYFISNCGDLYVCGFNTDGNLGLGDKVQRDYPTYVTGGVTSVEAGDTSAYFLTSHGDVYSCGENSVGQLGLGDTTERLTWTYATGGVDALSSGPDAANCLFLSGQEVYGCGINTQGGLGLGNLTSPITTPTLISGIPFPETGTLSMFDGLEWSSVL